MALLEVPKNHSFFGLRADEQPSDNDVAPPTGFEPVLPA